jgi:hypothetical protein
MEIAAEVLLWVGPKRRERPDLVANPDAVARA